MSLSIVLFHIMACNCTVLVCICLAPYICLPASARQFLSLLVIHFFPRPPLRAKKERKWEKKRKGGCSRSLRTAPYGFYTQLRKESGFTYPSLSVSDSSKVSPQQFHQPCVGIWRYCGTCGFVRCTSVTSNSHARIPPR